MKHGPEMVSVSRETSERLEAFAQLLRVWNAKINLVSHRDVAGLWQRHIEDSLQLAQFLPTGVSRAIDFGSGAGFPGLILSVATGISFDLIESDHRKAAFLREAARITAAPVTVHAIRIESARLPQAAVITARALAPLDKLLEFAAPMMSADAMCIFPKGAAVEQELTDARANWNIIVERHRSATDQSGTILCITGLQRA